MTSQEYYYEVLGRKIEVPVPPEPPIFPWEGGSRRRARVSMKLKPARRRLVRSGRRI